MCLGQCVVISIVREFVTGVVFITRLITDFREKIKTCEGAIE